VQKVQAAGSVIYINGNDNENCQ